MKNLFYRWMCGVFAAIICLSALVPVVVTVKSHKSTTSDELIDTTEWFVTDTVPTTVPENAAVEAAPTTEPTAPPTTEPELVWWVEMSDDDLWMGAVATYLEGGSESIECQTAIFTVMCNRMLERDMTLYDVLYESGQFSVAPYIASSCCNDEQIAIVNEVARYGGNLPPCVTFFRAYQYHDQYTVNTAYVKPYTVIDNTYFSHDIRICDDQCQK